MASLDTANFAGVTLSADRKDKLKIYLRSVLGDGNYTMTANFFMSVWHSKAEYKVFLPRRCLNLMHTFYRAIYDAPSTLPDDDFYSDGALIANSPSIAKEYIETGVMPTTLIIDDILIHGRALSRFISSYVDAVYDQLVQMGIEKDKTYLEDIILDSITVRTIVRSSDPLLIPNKYRRCLRYKTDGSDVWSPGKWHDFSTRLSLIMDRGYFCNTSFVLSLYENDRLDIHDLFAQAAESAGFVKSVQEKSDSHDVWVKPLKNSYGDIMAVYTLRINKSEVDNNYRLIPFVMMSDISVDIEEKTEGSRRISERIYKYFGSDGAGKRIRSEALYLLLSHNILLLLEQETGKKVISKKNLDIDKTKICFNVPCDTDFVSSVADSDMPLLSWNEMDKFILDHTAGSVPLLCHSEDRGNAFEECTDTAVYEFLACEGEKRETEAYLVNSGKNRIICGSGRIPVSELFNQISCGNIINIAGSVLRAADMGIASVSPLINNGKCACAFHAGEQSLFVRVRRFANEIPVLVAMERDCVRNKDEIAKRIDKFYGDDQSHAAQLKNFLDILYATGQRFCDWDINFSYWTDYPEEIRSSDKSDKDALLSRMLSAASERMMSVKKYYSMFPQKFF